MPTIRAITADDDLAERRAGWRWGGLIVGLLASQILIGFVAVWLAVGDPAWAVVPHYREKALHWNEWEQLQEASRHLGWEADLVIHAPANALGERQVEVALRDDEGRPIPGAAVQLELYHHARGADVLVSRPVESPSSPGLYVATVPARRPGLWEWRLDVHQGKSRFVMDGRDNFNW